MDTRPFENIGWDDGMKPLEGCISWVVKASALPRAFRVACRFAGRFGGDAWERQLRRREARRKAIAEVRLEAWMRSLGVDVSTGETMLERIERLREPTLMELLAQPNLFLTHEAAATES